MDRMFGVYIRIPRRPHLLLAAANELTRRAAAPPSLTWKENEC